MTQPDNAATANNEAAIQALWPILACTLADNKHMWSGHARVIIDAIRAGKVPGIAMKTYDGTTCWQCEECGKTRSGRGCMTCLQSQLATAKGEAREMENAARGYRDQVTSAVDGMEARTLERDAARAALVDCQAKELRAVRASTEMEARYYTEMAHTFRAQSERDAARAEAQEAARLSHQYRDERDAAKADYASSQEALALYVDALVKEEKAKEEALSRAEAAEGKARNLDIAIAEILFECQWELFQRAKGAWVDSKIIRVGLLAMKALNPNGETKP